MLACQVGQTRLRGDSERREAWPGSKSIAVLAMENRIQGYGSSYRETESKGTAG